MLFTLMRPDRSPNRQKQDNSMLQANNLVLNIPRAQGAAPLSFNLLEGQLLWVRGENGAGKSTLLKTLLGMIPPLEGTIVWQEQRPTLFYLSHDLGIQGQMTVLEYCFWHPAVLSQPSSAACMTVLKTVGLLPHAHRLAGQLSRGQQQRLLIACALLSDAKLWLLDEPLTALDTDSRQILLSCLLTHKHHGGTALVVSHYPISDISDGVIDVLV